MTSLQRVSFFFDLGGAIGFSEFLQLLFEDFDGVLGVTVLQNIPSKERAIAEISRILKKGARSVLSYPERAEVILPDFDDYGLRVLATTTIHEDRAVLLQRD